MKMMTTRELEQLKRGELKALFRTVSQNLMLTQAGSPARRNALATLENIATVLKQHP